MKCFVALLFCFAIIETREISSHLKRSPGVRIIGGADARSGQFPFAAALNIQTATSMFFCGGALISNEWILTAGHCVQGAVTITVRLGSSRLSGTDPNRITLSTSHSVVHPGFNASTSENDIGLIKLRLPIEFTDYIQPIGLAVYNLPNSAVPTAIGWGQTSDEDAELAADLQYVGLAVVPNAECQMIYGNQISNNTVCVEGNYNEGICFGDTGSPLVVRMIGATSVQHVGVASFFSGNGCESTDPSGYTRTAPYVDWIKNVTEIA